ncbi:hypothetical protein GSI_03560 [Ganoderma sinense ZZ0214-1]|uniref:Transcription factor n=1 Tax=Ganoderma sinense ZZ0214-1 TaxID=1077348 RepID=A0A2G8SJA2_9APHY|nr:hypothetical protein GSI_03560 [Ganoderma sinense ZZ0214-1]
MAPLRTSMRSIAEPSAIALAGASSTSATIKHLTSAACLAESGKTRGTQARKKACEYCYRVHKRCSGTFPCDRCIKAGCAAACTEHKRQRHARRGDAPGPPSRATAISVSGSSLRPFTGTANDDQTHSSIPVERVRCPRRAALVLVFI